MSAAARGDIIGGISRSSVGARWYMVVQGMVSWMVSGVIRDISCGV